MSNPETGVHVSLIRYVDHMMCVGLYLLVILYIANVKTDNCPGLNLRLGPSALTSLSYLISEKWRDQFLPGDCSLAIRALIIQVGDTEFTAVVSLQFVHLVWV